MAYYLWHISYGILVMAYIKGRDKTGNVRVVGRLRGVGWVKQKKGPRSSRLDRQRGELAAEGCDDLAAINEAAALIGHHLSWKSRVTVTATVTVTVTVTRYGNSNGYGNCNSNDNGNDNLNGGGNGYVSLCSPTLMHAWRDAVCRTKAAKFLSKKKYNPTLTEERACAARIRSISGGSRRQRAEHQ